MLQGGHKLGSPSALVDEAAGHNIPLGLDLAAMGSQCLLCGVPGQLRPYSHVQLLGAGCSGAPQACDVAWPTEQAFKYNNVGMQSAGPHVHWDGCHRFCTTSTLQFFLYRTRCRATACEYLGTAIPHEHATGYSHACRVHRVGAWL